MSSIKIANNSKEGKDKNQSSSQLIREVTPIGVYSQGEAVKLTTISSEMEPKIAGYKNLGSQMVVERSLVLENLRG